MIFTQTGHISKGLTVSSEGSEAGNHSALTLVCLVTHTVGVCLRRAFVCGPLCNNLPASSSLTEQAVLKTAGGRRQRGALSGQNFRWPSAEVKQTNVDSNKPANSQTKHMQENTKLLLLLLLMSKYMNFLLQ